MIRHMTFCGRSTADFSGVTVASADYGDIASKRSDTEIAAADGILNGSRVTGMHFAARTITYVLNVKAAPDTLEERISELREWLTASRGDLTDGFNEGWKFANADYLSSHVEYADMFRSAAELTVRFTADPYMQSAGGTRSRVYKFTAQGDTAFHVIDNAYIFQPEWSATPTASGNIVQISIPESGGMGTQYFTLSGISKGAEVTAATVTKDGESGGTISMIGNDSGSLYLAEKGAVIALAYSEEVSPTNCTGGHRAAVHSAEAPYTYRLKAYTEGTPTVKLNGTVLDLSQPFTMPDRALITIQNTGYGYYELWHDTTEVRL
jgi:hypothetical protein